MIEPYDYARACGNSGFTDFAINKMSKVVTEDSRYIISREYKGKTIYLQCNNFISIADEMNEMIKRGYFCEGAKSRKVKGYFIDENVIKFGNKRTGIKKIELDRADIKSIACKNYYFITPDHLTIQGDLIALGAYLGYGAKAAKNDKNKSIYEIPFSNITTVDIHSLNLNDLSQKSQKDIDYIDVIWYDRKTNEDIIAFEIEYKRGWKDALYRLNELYKGAPNRKVTCIVLSEKTSDYQLLKEYNSSNTFNFNSLAHITINNLLLVLSQYRILDSVSLKNLFFHELKYITE